MDRVFVDTSAWFAYTNRKDPEHIAVRDFVRGYRGRLVTSNYIFDETVSLCRFRLGHDAATVVGSVLMHPDEIDMIHVRPEDESTA